MHLTLLKLIGLSRLFDLEMRSLFYLELSLSCNDLFMQYTRWQERVYASQVCLEMHIPSICNYAYVIFNKTLLTEAGI